MRQGMPAEEIGCLAGWDAAYALMHHKWLIAGMDVADVAGGPQDLPQGSESRLWRDAGEPAALLERAEYRHPVRISQLSGETPAETPRSGLAGGRGFGHDDAPSADVVIGRFRSAPSVG